MVARSRLNQPPVDRTASATSDLEGAVIQLRLDLGYPRIVTECRELGIARP
jgi:hypothetical protein